MTSLTRCDCINVRHRHGKVDHCVHNAVEKCTTCGECLCEKCARQHHVHSDTEPLVLEQLVVPAAAKELALRVVVAFDAGRRWTLTTKGAALLREHALIDMLGEPTA